MATESTMPGIKNSWSLLAFAKMKGKMQIGQFTNSETGEQFKSCVFTDPNTEDRCFVAFSSKLGEMSASQIVSNKDNLQVVELESGNFTLCNKGASSWEDVNL